MQNEEKIKKIQKVAYCVQRPVEFYLDWWLALSAAIILTLLIRDEILMTWQGGENMIQVPHSLTIAMGTLVSLYYGWKSLKKGRHFLMTLAIVSCTLAGTFILAGFLAEREYVIVNELAFSAWEIGLIALFIICDIVQWNCEKKIKLNEIDIASMAIFEAAARRAAEREGAKEE